MRPGIADTIECVACHRGFQGLAWEPHTLSSRAHAEPSSAACGECRRPASQTKVSRACTCRMRWHPCGSMECCLGSSLGYGAMETCGGWGCQSSCQWKNGSCTVLVPIFNGLALCQAAASQLHVSLPYWGDHGGCMPAHHTSLVDQCTARWLLLRSGCTPACLHSAERFACLQSAGALQV